MLIYGQVAAKNHKMLENAEVFVLDLPFANGTDILDAVCNSIKMAVDANQATRGHPILEPRNINTPWMIKITKD